MAKDHSVADTASTGTILDSENMSKRGSAVVNHLRRPIPDQSPTNPRPMIPSRWLTMGCIHLHFLCVLFVFQYVLFDSICIFTYRALHCVSMSTKMTPNGKTCKNHCETNVFTQGTPTNPRPIPDQSLTNDFLPDPTQVAAIPTHMLGTRRCGWLTCPVMSASRRPACCPGSGKRRQSASTLPSSALGT